MAAGGQSLAGHQEQEWIGIMSSLKLVSTGLLVVLALAHSTASTGPEPRNVDVVQALSPRCSTPAGICFISPQPIGTPCSCGQFQGTIIW